MMEKSNKKGTLKVMMNNMSNGILPLDEHCITAFSRTTSGFKNVNKEVLMSGEKPHVHPVIYEQVFMKSY